MDGRCSLFFFEFAAGMPASDLIGLSKCARLAEWVLGRPQIQEEAVVMLASHFRMHWRGVKDDGR